MTNNINKILGGNIMNTIRISRLNDDYIMIEALKLIGGSINIIDIKNMKIIEDVNELLTLRHTDGWKIIGVM